MKFSSYHLLLLILLGSTVSIEHAQIDTPLFTSLQQTASSYFQNPFWQNAYSTVSNLCAIGSMCGSGLAWLGQKGVKGTAYTTEVIKNNPKIAGTIALYTAWYIGQKRWAEDTIKKAKEFFIEVNRSVASSPSFKTWRINQYPTIASIMNHKLTVGQNLVDDYDLFNTLSFCTCLKNKGTELNQQASAIKLALEIEYMTTKKVLDSFTEGRTVWLTYVRSWIKEWIQNNYNINGAIDIFNLYNILISGNTRRANPQLQNKREEIRAAEIHIENLTKQETQISNELRKLTNRNQIIRAETQKNDISEQITHYKTALQAYKIETTELQKQQSTQYEDNLDQFILQKIASTGLPSTEFLSEQPRAYWSWMQTAKWNIPSGFIWPYEREASLVYWDLFKYIQRVTALHSAISEYIKENKLPNSGSYNLNEDQQIINAVKQFLGNSPECNADYCIKRLEALRKK